MARHWQIVEARSTVRQFHSSGAAFVENCRLQWQLEGRKRSRAATNAGEAADCWAWCQGGAQRTDHGKGRHPTPCGCLQCRESLPSGPREHVSCNINRMKISALRWPTASPARLPTCTRLTHPLLASGVYTTRSVRHEFHEQSCADDSARLSRASIRRGAGNARGGIDMIGRHDRPTPVRIPSVTQH